MLFLDFVCFYVTNIKNTTNILTITVRSPGLPGQRFMMLEYRVPFPESPMQLIIRALVQAIRILLERVISWLSEHARFSGGFC